MLGNQGVTEANMMQYLGIIEQRTSEILSAYATSQHMSRPVEQQARRFYCHGMHGIFDGMLDGILTECFADFFTECLMESNVT